MIKFEQNLFLRNQLESVNKLLVLVLIKLSNSLEVVVLKYITGGKY